MNMTHSPWLAQLQQDRPHFRLTKNMESDIAVVGAGIAGVATAYYLLKLTRANVLLIDAGRIAHGATGRNAGQVVSYFERPLSDIARAFGTQMAVQGQSEIESAWGLLEDIIATSQLRTPFYRCKGFAGFVSIDQIVEQLLEKDLRAKAGLQDDPLLIHTGLASLNDIPTHLRTYLLEVPHSTVLRALQTEDAEFIAAEASPKGCMNSALFCEELIGWMTSEHGNRLTVAEHLPVEKISVGKERAQLTTTGPNISARKVVLCTNGFENFSIWNENGPEINTSFHATVRGYIGYMAGYLEEDAATVFAASYHQKSGVEDEYHYLTRRPYEKDQANHSLLCIGGPERQLPDSATYDPSTSFPGDIDEQLHRAWETLYSNASVQASRTFLWQGLMGYTANKIRRIGVEPKNTALLYNLGCNGVGILPSIFGGKRVAELIAGMHFPASIFDPDKGNV